MIRITVQAFARKGILNSLFLFIKQISSKSIANEHLLRRRLSLALVTFRANLVG